MSDSNVVKRSRLESTSISETSLITLSPTTKPKCRNLVDLTPVLIDKILSYIPLEFSDNIEQSYIHFADVCQAFRRSYTIRKLPVYVIISLKNMSDFQEFQGLRLQQYSNIISLHYIELKSDTGKAKALFYSHHCSHLIALIHSQSINHTKSTVKKLEFLWSHEVTHRHDQLLGMSLIEILKFFTSVTTLVMLPYVASGYIPCRIIETLNNNSKTNSTQATFNGFKIGEFCAHHSTPDMCILIPMPRCSAIKCLEYGRLICQLCDYPINTVKCSNFNCRRYLHPKCNVKLNCLPCLAIDPDDTIGGPQCGVCDKLGQCIECDLEFCGEHQQLCGRCHSDCCNIHITKLPMNHPFAGEYAKGLCYKCIKHVI